MRPFWRKFRNGRRKLAILLGFDTLVMWTHRKTASPPAGAIFSLHGLGDLLLASRAIAGLNEYFREQGLETVLFVPAWLADFARRHLPVDRVEGVSVEGFCEQLDYRAMILRSVAGRFRIAVQPTYNRRLIVEDALVRATGARQRIGSDGHMPFIRPSERWLGNWFYTRLVRQQPAPMNELARYAEFMAGLGLSIPAEAWRISDPGRPAGPLALPATAFLVVCPHSSDRFRDWPMDNFLRAACQIAIEQKLAIVIIGRSAASLPPPWLPGDNGPVEVVDLCGQITTADLPALLARAELILCNDSGAYHLGVSLDRPTVAVGGGGMPVRYFPYPFPAGARSRVLARSVACAGCTWRCIYPDVPGKPHWCVSLISWPEVVAAARQLLQSPG